MPHIREIQQIVYNATASSPQPQHVLVPIQILQTMIDVVEAGDELSEHTVIVKGTFLTEYKKSYDRQRKVLHELPLID